MISRLKNKLFWIISRNRHSSLATAVHRLSSFFEAAWHNENDDFARNGERFVVERLARAYFDVAVDAGANVGEWTLQALALWPACVVHAIEVAPRTYEELARVCANGPAGLRAHAHPFGLSNRPGSATFYYFPGYPKLTASSPRHENFESVPFEAHLRTLDDFCDEAGLDRIDFLKIDVEGAEHEVLEGARNFLLTKRINCIQFEYGAFAIDSRRRMKDYFDLLADRYLIGKIYPNHVDFADYDWRMENFRFANYLCIRRDRPDLVSLLTTSATK
jgi:FkbM family methyltransferase